MALPAPEFAALAGFPELAEFHYRVRFPATSFMPGHHASQVRGGGIEAAALVPLARARAPRRLDWRASPGGSGRRQRGQGPGRHRHRPRAAGRRGVLRGPALCGLVHPAARLRWRCAAGHRHARAHRRGLEAAQDRCLLPVPGGPLGPPPGAGRLARRPGPGGGAGCAAGAVTAALQGRRLRPRRGGGGPLQQRQHPSARSPGAGPVAPGKQQYREALRRDPGHWPSRYNLERALWLAPELPDGNATGAAPEPSERAVTTMRGFTLGLP